MFSADSCSKQRSHKFAPFLRPEQGILSGVEKRRSDVSLPVAIGQVFTWPPQSSLAWCCFLLPSRPGEFRPEPLTDPCLTVSGHTARATPGRLAPSAETIFAVILFERVVALQKLADHKSG
jgi:hypothetical protein